MTTVRACEQGTVRDDPPGVNDFGLVVRVIGGIVIVGPVVVNQGTSPWIVQDILAEAILASIDGKIVHVDTNNVTVVASALPAGAATEATLATRASEATLATRLADATFTARINTLGQKAMAASTPVVLASDQSTLPIKYADTPQLDAFSRVRISTPHTIFSSKMLLDNQPLLWDDQQVSGGGTTSTYSSATASVTLLAAGGTAGRRVRQTFRRFSYQPGKSQLIMMTGDLAMTGAGNAAIKRRVGYYDDANGFFFAYEGATMNVALRTSTSGAPVDTLIPQNTWNLDQLDGSGPSGITLDITMAQLFLIDFQWLSVGRIRFGFDIGGQIIYVHQINPANTQQLPSIGSPNLPLRYEIISLGGGAGNATMTQICSTVVSEGGSEHFGFPFFALATQAEVTTGNDINVYGLIALQLQAGKLAASVVLDALSVISTTANASYIVSLYINPTIAGAAPVYTNLPNSAVKYAFLVAANLLTLGTQIYAEIVASNHSGGATINPSDDRLSIGSSIAGVSDTMVLAVQPMPMQGATKFSGALCWREVV